MCFLRTLIIWLCLIRWHGNRINYNVATAPARREYWCFYMNMSTTLSVRYRANKQETTSRANIRDNSSRVLEIYMTKLVSGFLVLFSEIMVRSRYKANWCAFETEFPHYMSCVEENIFASILFPPTLQAAAYWYKMHDKSVCNLTRRTSKNIKDKI